ncbi:MAG: NapC/NirT family cytochrome c, partial [Chloroflexi bacterium]|nr:NapC/NirT family cytochrome c [Chloroflexota bacterium]
MRRLRRLISSTYNFRFSGYFLMGAGIFVLLILASVPPAWEYSNSPGFCGTTCHTMPPAFATYEESPHSNVLCVDCHIGRDLILIQASRKVEHSRLIWATVMDDFEYPIKTSSMRPARDTCEHCHNPEKFADDSVRIVERAENDRDNSLYTTYLLMHTGGGDERTGIARGIHWHIENEISYIALDEREQDIPWVQVRYDDGSVVQYNALNSP